MASSTNSGANSREQIHCISLRLGGTRFPGNPTVACEVRLRGGATGTATAPSGASTGAHEAHELRDGQQDRYRGKGVSQAVANVNGALAQAVIGKDSGDQATVDSALRAADGSANLSRLGANATLAVSVASLQAAAAAAGQPLWRYAAADDRPAELPLPMINILSGGAHAGRAVDIQDVLVIPTGASNFAQALEWVDRVRAATAARLHDMGHSTALVADEGGYGPQLSTNRTALEVVTLAIERAAVSAREPTWQSPSTLPLTNSSTPHPNATSWPPRIGT